MILLQGTNILINCIDAVVDTMNFKAISNIQILTLCIATILTKLTGKCIATIPCILEVEIDDVISIQNPQL